MSTERARECLARYGLGDRVRELNESSATVALAAAALGCAPERIAKTLSFQVGERVALIVAAGDAKVDNAKFKAQFGCKAVMLKADEAEPRIGHAVGGVCPFGVKDGVDTYLDVSLRRFETVFPAAGASNCVLEMTLPELEQASESLGFVDVCKGWND